MSQSPPTPNYPDNGPYPGSPDGPRGDSDLQDLRDKLDEIDDKLEKGSKDNGQKKQSPTKLSVETLEDVYYAVLIAGGMLGTLGLVTTIALSAYGFSAIFIIGLVFLSYAYHTGLPSEV